MLAAIQAVKAEDAFADSYISRRLAAAFAVAFAQFAIYTFGLPAEGGFDPVQGFALANSPDSQSVNYTEQRTKRTEKSAIESWNHQIEQNRC